MRLSRVLHVRKNVYSTVFMINLYHNMYKQKYLLSLPFHSSLLSTVSIDDLNKIKLNIDRNK